MPKEEENLTYPFNRISFLLSHVDLMRAGGQGGIIFLAQKLEKLFLVLTDELRNLRISGGDLLEDGLKHLWLLLD